MTEACVLAHLIVKEFILMTEETNTMTYDHGSVTKK